MARRVVIVILAYNAARFIGPCLDALRAHTPLPHRTVVVDNASSDGTLDIVKERYPDVEAVQTGANLGVSKGNNYVLAQYDADLHVMLNPDTQVHAGWLEALVEEAESDARIGIVGGKLLYPDGRIQHVGGEARPTGPRHVGVLAPGESYSEPRDVDFVTLACGLIKREVIERIGYLDEAYTPFYYEDADLCFRARAAGFRVRYTPRCVVTHHEGAAMQKDISVAKARILERNRLRFKFTHDPKRWWLRSAWQEAKTLVGHTARGRGAAIFGAWGDMWRARTEIQARRRERASFITSVWSPSGRHEPTRRV